MISLCYVVCNMCTLQNSLHSAECAVQEESRDLNHVLLYNDFITKNTKELGGEKKMKHLNRKLKGLMFGD